MMTLVIEAIEVQIELVNGVIHYKVEDGFWHQADSLEEAIAEANKEIVAALKFLRSCYGDNYNLTLAPDLSWTVDESVEF